MKNPQPKKTAKVSRKKAIADQSDQHSGSLKTYMRYLTEKMKAGLRT